MGRGKSSEKRGERGEMKKVLTTTLRVAVRRVAARVNQKVEAAVEVVKKVVLGVRRAVTKMRGDLPQAGERRRAEGQTQELLEKGQRGQGGQEEGEKVNSYKLSPNVHVFENRASQTPVVYLKIVTT